MKIATIVGARPQFIKAAVLSRLFARNDGIHEVLIHTGQHYDDEMSEVFFRELGIPKPGYNLGVGSGPHGFQTAKMLLAIEKVLLLEKPDCVVVYGDTNTTLAGALAASKLHIPLAHVEAGLRSFNRRMPEETNRVLTDHCSDLLFTPTTAANEHLHNEGIQKGIHLVGDVMYDAVLRYAALAKSKSNILTTLGLESSEYVLGTIHRAENTNSAEHLGTILEGFSQLAQRMPVVLPLHPRTRLAARNFGIDFDTSGLNVIDPVGYLDMAMLEKSARIVVTDSGGVQKESFFHRVPCVTLRAETEWTELVAAGWNRLAPPETSQMIVQQAEAALASRPTTNEFLYGDGHAGEKIIDILLRDVGVLTPAELTKQDLSVS
jgi:UDP-GlcNAc3NAcA epimerase